MSTFFIVILCLTCLFFGILYGIKQTKKNYGIPKQIYDAKQLRDYVVDNYEFN